MQPVSKALRMELEFLSVGSASCAETVTCSGFQPGGVLFDSSSMNRNLGVPGKIMISELLILWPSTYSPSVLINMTSYGKLPGFLCRKCLLDRELSQEYIQGPQFSLEFGSSNWKEWNVHLGLQEASGIIQFNWCHLNCISCHNLCSICDKFVCTIIHFLEAMLGLQDPEIIHKRLTRLNSVV
jgi:hypothetical protein